MRLHQRGGSREAFADEVRERRLAEVRSTVEEFVYRLAMAVAGHDPDFSHCASRAVERRLKDALHPLSSSSHTVRPDFGTHAELRVEGDLLCTDAPVHARVEFEDHSLRQEPGRRGVAVPRRRITIALELALQPCQVVGYAVRTADAA